MRLKIYIKNILSNDYTTPYINFSTYVYNVMCKYVDKLNKLIYFSNNMDDKFNSNNLYTTYTQTNKLCNCMIFNSRRCYFF